MEVIFEFLFELVIQIVGELLLEFGLHAMAEPFRRRADPWVAALGYALFGIALGALSLWPFPQSMIHGAWLRRLNVVAAPVGVGLFSSLLGRWRARRGDPVLRIDRFAWGFLFAFFFALVRFLFAR